MFDVKLNSSTAGSQTGSALLLVVMISALLFPMLFSGVRFSSLNLQMSSNLKLGDTALQVADTGIQHALAVIPSGGTFGYTSLTTIVPTSGSGTVAHPTLTGYSYSVTAINTAGGTKAILTSTATGPGDVRKVVTGYIERGNYGLGATSLAGSTAPATETNFSGTAFSIDGTDQCGAAPAVPGIGVTDPDLQTEITNDTTSDGGLASNQMNLISGAGGSPSVVTVAPMEVSVSELADAYLCVILTCTDGVPPDTDCTEAGDTVLCGDTYAGGTWGTSLSPQITQIKGNARITGDVTGNGVLIVDGVLDIAGHFTFNGLVIARGDIQVQVTGDAGIYGSLMLGESLTYDPQVELDVRGNATIRFNSCNLNPADSWITLPKQAKLVAWHEKLN